MSAATSRQGTLVSRRVLVIEDNADGRETLRLFLELIGHSVEVAEDGLEGVRKALALKPDAAIIDLGLPRLNGYEVARQLRAAFGNSIVLIAHTGYSRAQDRRRSYEAGFDVHLVKPVDLDELCYWLAHGPLHEAPEH
jgi:CheY-like chemotaxis protein